MNYSVQEAALRYAESLVAFYESVEYAKSGLREDENAMRNARDVMYDAQSLLTERCQRQAALSFE